MISTNWKKIKINLDMGKLIWSSDVWFSKVHLWVNLQPYQKYWESKHLLCIFLKRQWELPTPLGRKLTRDIPHLAHFWDPFNVQRIQPVCFQHLIWPQKKLITLLKHQRTIFLDQISLKIDYLSDFCEKSNITHFSLLGNVNLQVFWDGWCHS